MNNVTKKKTLWYEENINIYRAKYLKDLKYRTIKNDLALEMLCVSKDYVVGISSDSNYINSHDTECAVLIFSVALVHRRINLLTLEYKKSFCSHYEADNFFEKVCNAVDLLSRGVVFEKEKS